MAKADGWVTKAVVVGVCVEALEAFDEVEGWDVDRGAGAGGCGGGEEGWEEGEEGFGLHGCGLLILWIFFFLDSSIGLRLG